MDLTREPNQPLPGRRGLLFGTIALAAAVVTGSAGRALGHLAGAARPAARGRSSGRCAQCGGWDHAMLSPQCPQAPGVV